MDLKNLERKMKYEKRPRKHNKPYNYSKDCNNMVKMGVNTSIDVLTNFGGI